MREAVASLFSFIFDSVVPPRPSERVVRTITVEELRGLGEESLLYHDPRVTALVWELKYHASRRAAALAGALLSETLMAVAAEELGQPLLVPVPMHKARRRERGYNQTELLCEATIKELRKQNFSEKSLAHASVDSGGRFLEKVPGGSQTVFSSPSASIFEYAPRALVRMRATPTQQGLPKHVRLRNVAGSMEATNPKIIKGRVCVVVDDVSTTGATLAEAKRALIEAGARSVVCITLARS